MKIAIATDHAGVALKEALIEWLNAHHFTVEDLGAYEKSSVDYPDYAAKVVKSLVSKTADRGILICGSGIGMSIAANRHPHIRAALCLTPEFAKLARQHNDANILVLAARFSDQATLFECMDAFLNTDFEGGRHEQRIAKLRQINQGGED